MPRPSAKESASVRRPDVHPLLALRDEVFVGWLALTGWGVSRWKWFREPISFKAEHWFSARSKTGGSDKVAHFHVAFMASDVLAWRLRQHGYGAGESALFGAVGAGFLMTWIEMGDSTSDYGFSLEDLTMDYLGVGVSVGLQALPALDRLVDLRVQYWPSKTYFEAGNPVADYSGMKHLVALRGSGVGLLADTPLRFVELHGGYYSRGFRSFDTSAERRVLYVGIGFDLSELLRPVVPKPVATVFQYYQVPLLSRELAAHDL